MVKKVLLLLALCMPIAAVAQSTPGFTKIGSTAAGVTTFTDSGCQNTAQNTCYYEVTAVDANGHESAISACAANAPLCFNGNQAQIVMPGTGTHTVSVTWLASTTIPAPIYNVYRAVGPLPPTGMTATVN